MKYLLNTDVLVDHLRKKAVLPKDLVSSGICVSVITRAELLFGAYNSEAPAKELEKIDFAFGTLQISVLHLDNSVLHFYAQAKVSLNRVGRPLDDFDLLIGATALAFDLNLVTRNTEHFVRIPNLKLRSPTDFSA